MDTINQSKLTKEKENEIMDNNINGDANGNKTAS